MLCRCFHQCRLDYLSHMLEVLPRGNVGKRKGRDIVRVYYGDRNSENFNRKEYLLDSPKGRKALAEINHRSICKAQFLKYYSLWNTTYTDRYCPNALLSPKIDIRLKSDEWNAYLQSARLENSKKSDEYPYSYKGIKMRSRFEVVVAEVLDSMDLDFVYEPKIIMGSSIYVPDFIVNVPELGCCFVIECLGMIDDEYYFTRNMDKYRHYTSNGFYHGRDIIYIYGHKNSMPSPQQIRGLINGTLEYLCWVT